MNVSALLWLDTGEGPSDMRFGLNIKCGKFEKMEIIWNRPLLGAYTLQISIC